MRKGKRGSGNDDDDTQNGGIGKVGIAAISGGAAVLVVVLLMFTAYRISQRKKTQRYELLKSVIPVIMAYNLLGTIHYSQVQSGSGKVYEVVNFCLLCVYRHRPNFHDIHSSKHTKTTSVTANK